MWILFLVGGVFLLINLLKTETVAFSLLTVHQKQILELEIRENSHFSCSFSLDSRSSTNQSTVGKPAESTVQNLALNMSKWMRFKVFNLIFLMSEISRLFYNRGRFTILYAHSIFLFLYQHSLDCYFPLTQNWWFRSCLFACRPHEFKSFLKK